MLCICVSCSKDQDNETPNESPLIGTWNPVFSMDYSCLYGTYMKIHFADECALEDVMSFTENGFSETFFTSDGDDCIFKNSNQGNWKVVDGNLMLDEDVYNYFEVSQDTLKFGFTYYPNDGSCDESNAPGAYYFVYARAK